MAIIDDAEAIKRLLVESEEAKELDPTEQLANLFDIGDLIGTYGSNAAGLISALGLTTSRVKPKRSANIPQAELTGELTQRKMAQEKAKSEAAYRKEAREMKSKEIQDQKNLLDMISTRSKLEDSQTAQEKQIDSNLQVLEKRLNSYIKAEDKDKVAKTEDRIESVQQARALIDSKYGKVDKKNYREYLIVLEDFQANKANKDKED